MKKHEKNARLGAEGSVFIIYFDNNSPYPLPYLLSYPLYLYYVFPIIAQRGLFGSIKPLN